MGRGRMVVVGNSGVGKSTLLNVQREIEDECLPTIFVEHLLIQLRGEECGEKCKLKVDVYDMGGSNKFLDFVQIYIRQADSVILVFETWEDVAYLRRAIRDLNFSPVQHITLLHSKQDIRPDLTPSQIHELVTYFKPQLYARTSARDPKSIKHVF